MQLKVKWNRIVEEFNVFYDNMFVNSKTKRNISVHLDLTGILIEKPNVAWRPLVILDTMLSMLAIDKMHTIASIGRKFDQYKVLKQSIMNVISESFIDFQMTSFESYEQSPLSPIITIIDFPNEWLDNNSLFNFFSNGELLAKSNLFSDEIEVCFNNYYMKAYGIQSIIVKICITVYSEVFFMSIFFMNDCSFHIF